MSRWSRWVGLLLLLAGLPAGSAGALEPAQKRMIVFGVDGMDPGLLRQFMGEGLVPNLAALAGQGGFIPLGTSIPPQSPVAWSNFITGMDSGGHGIFDFLALDRETMVPYLSTARVVGPGSKPLAIGKWRIPLGSERTVQLRAGKTFWALLEDAGIPTTIFRIPANYPPVKTSGHAISGMGTPDLRGTPGVFSYYTDDPSVEAGSISGGVIQRVSVRDGTVRATLGGPPNAFLADSPTATVAFSVHVDPANPVAVVRVGDEQVVLNRGEWSEWVAVRFSLIPGLAEVPGMVRFFLKSTSPHFALYASPVNIDPRNPAQPIAIPAEYARELAEAAGPFYTQEMPEDTKALSAGVLTPREFLHQSGLVLDERRRLLRRELERFLREQRRGLLFFYVSSVDQRHHMVYRHTDPDHPYHEKDTPEDLADAMRTVYREIDEMVGWLMAAIDDHTRLIVMSDHGFASFRRQANLNAWLERAGYLTISDPGQRDQVDWLQGINWSKTRAFAIGLNSLYLNVRGRERFGIVKPAEREALAREIAAKLLTWRDESSGAQVVTQPVVREDVYHGPYVEVAPDIIVGYARGYRASWATTSGKVPATLIDDNIEEWSGDHCIDAREVPGVLLSSGALRVGNADLKDLTVSILNYFGLEPLPDMKGNAAF